MLSSSGNLVIIGCEDNNVYALHMESGRVAWSTPTSAQVRGAASLGPNGNHMLLIGSEDTNAYALNEATGAIQWQFRTNDVVRGRPVWLPGLALITSNDTYLYAVVDYHGGSDDVGVILLFFAGAAVLVVAGFVLTRRLSATRTAIRNPQVRACGC